MEPTRRVVLGMLGAGAAAATGLAFVPWRPRSPRSVQLLLPGEPTSDGAGVRLTRAVGSRALRNLDPFLLLDQFKTDRADDYIAGFPDHPHRGFETVTVMIDGAMEHRDSVGNRGLLSPGSVQWMTAGRGIVHSEMPRQVEGRMWGFQLWVNLPARLKMTPPRYQDLAANLVPEVDVGDARARVLAGLVGRTRGPVDGVVVDPTVLDVTIPTGGRFVHDLPGAHTAFVWVTEGAAHFGVDRREVPANHLAVLSPGETVLADGASRFLLVAGAPIGEPIARRGPFVMNTDAEIDQAYADYRSGRLVGG
jgi:redox-sensitive bicupin YhaK (pirin superfamily)